jgi:hypothetical protein
MIKEVDMYENVDIPDSQGVYIHICFKCTGILGNML